MRNTWKIYLLTFMTFLLGTAQFVIVGILGQVATSFGVTLSAAGQLITVFALANAFGTPLVMVAAARVDLRRRLLLGLVILLIGVVATAALPGFGLLMASRAVLGVGNGVFVATAYTLAPKLAAAGREVGAMANVALGFSASLVFGVPLGRVVAQIYDWRVIFWGIAVFAVLGIVAVAWAIPAMAGQAPVALHQQFRLMKQRKIAVAFIVTFWVYIGYSVVNTYITPYVTTVVGIRTGDVSAFLFGFGIACLIGSKLGGLLADRIGASRTLVGGMLFEALSLVLLAVVPRSVMVGISSFMLWGLAAWAFLPPQNFHLISTAPEASGILLSLNNSFVQLGLAVGAAVGGVVVGGSLAATPWIGAGAVLVGAGFWVASRTFAVRTATS